MTLGRGEQWRGTRLGAYEALGLIGHGTTASVLEGVHVALGKPVAIKVLREQLAENAPVRARFVREGRLAARLHHPNIVDILDVGEEGDVPYLVMELLRGMDLRVLLTDASSLRLEHALAFLLPIASALAHAHDAGVIHRDLKPANIFLARDARDSVVPKLVDFGLSKAILNDAGASLTETDLIAGTALYMAPEQTRGMKNACPGSDQYALAAILYEALTGRPPFAPDAVPILLERIRTESVRPPSEVTPTLPPRLDEVLLRAMHRDPDRRFPSVRAFGAALLPFVERVSTSELERDFADRAGPPSGGALHPSSRRQIIVAETRSEVDVAPRSRTGPGSPSSPSSAKIALFPPPPETPLPCDAGASPFHMKGMAYRGFIRLVEKSAPGGLPGFREALADARLRDFVAQPFLASARYDVLPMVPLFATLARLCGVPFGALVEEASAVQCRYDVKTVFKMMFREGEHRGLRLLLHAPQRAVLRLREVHGVPRRPEGDPARGRRGPRLPPLVDLGDAPRLRRGDRAARRRAGREGRPPAPGARLEAGRLPARDVSERAHVVVRPGRGSARCASGTRSRSLV